MGILTTIMVALGINALMGSEQARDALKTILVIGGVLAGGLFYFVFSLIFLSPRTTILIPVIAFIGVKLYQDHKNNES